MAGLLEFALSEPEIMCELIADGHHVSTTLMKMLFRAKGADGICLVTDATAGAGLPDGARFQLAGVDCVAPRRTSRCRRRDDRRVRRLGEGTRRHRALYRVHVARHGPSRFLVVQ